MEPKRNILIIAYYFPPSGGPGVQRVLKHVKYLPDWGWNPIVLTVSNGQYPAVDESLLEQIPKGTTVIRTKLFEPYDIYRMFTGKKPGSAVDVNVIKKDGQKSSFKERIAEFIRATFFIPDARMSWYFTSKQIVDETIKKYNIEAIYSSSPPYTCSLIARRAKKKHNLMWVAGFRDPWTGFISSPKRWFLPAMIDRKLEYLTFKDADKVECAWEGIMKDVFNKYPMIDRTKFRHIPNGFDSNDFPKVEEIRNSKFTVTYTGSMYGRRNPAAIFQAVEELIAERRISQTEIKFKFIGRFGDEVHEMFKNASFSNNIEVIDYIPHKESIRHLLHSDALLLIVDESKESNEIVPGKVYEYIGVKKPIIANAPEKSAIAELLKYSKAGKVAHQDNITKIKEIFEEYYKAWKNGNVFFEPDNKIISQFERRHAAGMLADLFYLMIEARDDWDPEPDPDEDYDERRAFDPDFNEDDEDDEEYYRSKLD